MFVKRCLSLLGSGISILPNILRADAMVIRLETISDIAGAVRAIKHLG